MAFSLTTKEIQYWNDRLTSSYGGLKEKVVSAFTEEEISFDKVKDIYFEVLQRKINERIADINSSNWSHFNIDIYAPSEHNFSVLSHNERCLRIREICTPYAQKRDHYREILVSKPTEDEFREVISFCREMDNYSIEKQIDGELSYHE